MTDNFGFARWLEDNPTPIDHEATVTVLEDKTEGDETVTKFKCGDKVQTRGYKRGVITKIVGLLTSEFPYLVKYAEDDEEWCSANELTHVGEDTTAPLPTPDYLLGDKVRSKHPGWTFGLTGEIMAVDLNDSQQYTYRVAMNHPGTSVYFLADELESATSAPPAETVDHPSHYTWLPNGLEVIDITKYFSFVRGNAIKYLMRASHKGSELEDLRKARWYLDLDIKQLEEKED